VFVLPLLYCQIVRGGGYGSVFTLLKGIPVFWVLPVGSVRVPDIRSLPAVNGEEDEGGRLCSPMWDLAEREKYFIVLYGTVGNKSRY
jgi:hypothetical protein